MAKRDAISNRRVPFLPDRQIEQEAEVLLAEYGQAHGAARLLAAWQDSPP